MNLKQAIVISVGFCGLTIGAATATAQEAEAAASAQPAPQADATAQASASVNDTEVKQFAQAALAVQQIRDDTATPDADKQPKMAAAVQQSGLSPQRFNEIAQASQTDTQLSERIQLAANALVQPAAPPTPAAPAQ